jgi:hypothetical protein
MVYLLQCGLLIGRRGSSRGEWIGIGVEVKRGRRGRMEEGGGGGWVVLGSEVGVWLWGGGRSSLKSGRGLLLCGLIVRLGRP